MRLLAKKFLLGLLILGIPLAIFTNVWYAYRYYDMNQQIAELEEQQLEIIERNKRIITGISIQRSPGRIINEARKLGLEMTGWEQIVILEDDS